jgi:DNA-binding CsgD family transcriptional regulator
MMFSENAWNAIGQSLELSKRELEIVRGVFADRTEYTIANSLHISPHTVHTHVERLHHKLRVANRVQLVLRVMDEFLGLTVSPQSKLPPVCANWEAGACPFAGATR